MHWFELLSALYDERDVPLFHEWVSTDIRIDIDISGNFISAEYRPERSLVPITELSANRTVNIAPHPLCDTLQNLTEPIRHAAYLAYLGKWATSQFSDKRLFAVLHYVQNGSLLSDLRNAGIEPKPHSMVRFSVCGKEVCGDKELILSHIGYTRSLPCEMGICCVSGEYTSLCRLHPKRITSPISSAKLISKRERERLGFGGIFHCADDVFPLGREVSFKAHAALKRLISQGGLRLQEHTFIAFDEHGNTLPLPFQGKTAEPFGSVTILGFCEATKGRLSVTLYKRLSVESYLKALKKQRLPERHSGVCYEKMLSKLL